MQLKNNPASPEDRASFVNARSRARGLRGLGFLVLAALALLQSYEVFRCLDFRDYDDLVRTLLARTWAVQPYYMLGDGYWLTLPAIARGAWLRLFPADVMQHPMLAVTLMRLVTLGYLWGCWRLLAEAVRMLGGGRLALLLFTAFFLFNGGTFHFAASNYSEADSLFWTLAALVAVLGGLERGGFSARRVFVYGVALAAACQTRYEAWPLPLVFGALILWHSRQSLRPGWRWAGLLLPALPILLWIALSALRQGHPFNFLLLQNKYVGVYRPDDPLIALVKCFLKIHPLWLPVAGVAGLLELVRQRRRPVTQCYFIATGLLLAWALTRLWCHQMTVRFAWDATLMLAAAGAVGLARGLHAVGVRRPDAALMGGGLMRRAIARPCAMGFVALCFLIWVGIGLRQRPYIPPGLRIFAAAVQRQTGDGKILFDDRLPAGEEYALVTFRVSIVTERLVLASWLMRDGRIPPGAPGSAQIRYLLGKTDALGLAAGQPLLSDPVTGWKLWRCR